MIFRWLRSLLRREKVWHPNCDLCTDIPGCCDCGNVLYDVLVKEKAVPRIDRSGCRHGYWKTVFGISAEHAADVAAREFAGQLELSVDDVEALEVRMRGFQD